jgi:hypothetical protein
MFDDIDLAIDLSTALDWQQHAIDVDWQLEDVGSALDLIARTHPRRTCAHLWKLRDGSDRYDRRHVWAVCARCGTEDIGHG